MPRGRGEQPPESPPVNYGQPGVINEPGNTRGTIEQVPPTDRTPRTVPVRGKHYTPRPSGPWPGARPRTAPVRRTTGPTAQAARQVSYNAANGPIPIGYGTLKTGVGFIMRPKVSGNYIYTAGVVSEGEIDSYISTKVDGRLITDIGGVVNSYTGTGSQTTDTMLSGVEGQWDNALLNLAYHALKIPVPNSTTGDFDVTKIETVWRGKKVYDPRGPTTAWSDNPALIWADLATNTRYGGCIPSANIDWDSVGDAADDCDYIVGSPPDAPTDPPTVTRVVGGGNLSLSQLGYRWGFTNVDTDGFESALSPLSVGPSSDGLIVNNGDSVDLSDVVAGPSGTVARKIYRTKKDSLSPLRFVGTINDNSTTTFTDTLADSALGGFPQSGPYKRYVLDLLVQNVAPWPQWDESIRAHFACLKVWNAGKWKLIVDKSKVVSGVTFSDQGADRNLVGFPLVRTKGAKEIPDLVTVSYIDRFNDYSAGSVQWPSTPPAAPKNEQRFDLQGVPGHQALRLAKYIYNLRLRNREYTFRTMQRGAYPLPGAVVELTSMRGPLSAEKLLLLNTEPDGLGWKHQAENYDDGVYGDDVIITEPPIVEPPDPYADPPNVTGLTAPTDTEAQIGTAYWTPAVWPNVAGYYVYDLLAFPTPSPIFVSQFQSPTSDFPLDLRSLVHVDADGTRHFSIKVVTATTTGRVSSGAVVSWDLAVASQPRDKTIYNINNGAVFATATGWSTVHGAASGSVVTQGSSSGTLHIDAAEESGTPGDYSIWRAFFEFDLTDIFPADATVVSARLELYPKPYYPTRDTTIYAVESTANAAPFDTADFDAIGTTSFGSIALTATQTGRYYSIDLNNDGLTFLDLFGMNKFAFITDDDFNDSTPDSDSFRHDVAYDSTELVANGVRLVVTYNSDSEDQTGPPTGVNIQTFTTPGTDTWVKPAGAKTVRVVCTGAGGGGGGAAGTFQAVNSGIGGSGGGGGARTERTMLAADLPATVTVTVGTGGTGGAGGVTTGGAGASGSNGTGGGSSSFGSYLTAYGGGRGAGGNFGTGQITGGGGGGGLGAGANAAGSGDSIGGAPTVAANVDAFGTGGASSDEISAGTITPRAAEYGGGAGGGGASASLTTRKGGTTLYGGGGGGGGGGHQGSGADVDGDDGGASGVYSSTGGGGGAKGTGGGNGTAGDPGDTTKGGDGGGGGDSKVVTSGTTVAGDGGDGGAPGGGGGGGGAAGGQTSQAGTTGGTGGDGARGEVVVYSW